MSPPTVKRKRNPKTHNLEIRKLYKLPFFKIKHLIWLWYSWQGGHFLHQRTQVRIHPSAIFMKNILVTIENKEKEWPLKRVNKFFKPFTLKRFIEHFIILILRQRDKTDFFLKKWAIPGLFFFIFDYSIQLTANKYPI